MKKAADQAEDARSELPKQKTGHRGNFSALTFGISHGQGQLRPMRLRQDDVRRRVLEDLLKERAFKRLAGFQSGNLHSKSFLFQMTLILGCLLAWAPKLHQHYAEHLQAIITNDPELDLNFDNSVFACATVNLGPRTVCFRHTDRMNLPYGWCAITPFGNFDHTKGGHLILWELRLVIEFPPGSTILLPSACISHSNVDIDQSETRFSFTQYTAGSLFRWADHGLRLEGEFWSSLSEDEIIQEKKRGDARLSSGLSLLRTLP